MAGVFKDRPLILVIGVDAVQILVNVCGAVTVTR
jgi:hypothetical protein